MTMFRPPRPSERLSLLQAAALSLLERATLAPTDEPASGPHLTPDAPKQVDGRTPPQHGPLRPADIEAAFGIKAVSHGASKTPMAAEIAEHNAAVDRRRNEKRMPKLKRGVRIREQP